MINLEWEFYVPIFDIVYKPWRLFMIVCAIPSILSYLALMILPESPKFMLSQGNQQEAIKILEQINRWNNGGKAAKSLGIEEIYEEAESIEIRLRQQEQKMEKFSWLKSMWTQTAPLFMRPYLRTTILSCTLQFGVYATSNGFYMWFAEIMNRLGTNLDDFSSARVRMCDVISNTTAIQLADESEQVLVQSLCCIQSPHTLAPTKQQLNNIVFLFRCASKNLNSQHWSTALLWKFCIRLGLR